MLRTWVGTPMPFQASVLLYLHSARMEYRRKAWCWHHVHMFDTWHLFHDQPGRDHDCKQRQRVDGVEGTTVPAARTRSDYPRFVVDTHGIAR